MSYTTTFTVDRSPAEVFAAVTDPRRWWSEEIEGGTAAVGDEFDYHMRDLHITRMRVTEVVPDRRVTWLVLANHFAFTTDKSEWVGTTITFEITETGAGTVGVLPRHEPAGGGHHRQGQAQLNGTHQVPQAVR